jgi:hypothetical protein
MKFFPSACRYTAGAEEPSVAVMPPVRQPAQDLAAKMPNLTMGLG